jgi:hypothetical protein
MPTEEQTYRDGIKRMLEEISRSVEQQAESLEEQRKFSYSTANSLSRIELKTQAIETQAKYTNGKVRKIIIALVLIGGILIGQTFTNPNEIITLFTHIAL